MPLLDFLACPRCGAAALQGDAAYGCTACNAQFPRIGGVPWLFPEPEAALAEWRGRSQFLLQHLGRDAQLIRDELGAVELRASTRTRLKLLAGAYDDQARRLRAVLAPLGIDAGGAALETYQALRTRLPESQALTSYYQNVHRDWCWGQAENEASLKVVADVVGGDPLGSLLVLGAGAGRLAYDVHQRLAPTLTIAADINPLLVLAGARVLGGEKTALYEFPIAPRSAEESAPLRTLAAPAPVREGFHFVFADAMHSPFRRERFDAVLTPWFVDIVPEEFTQLARRINQWLAPGGRWINFGSLAFAQAQAARCYNLGEALEIVADAGFDVASRSEAAIPYMQSPASRHARIESVIAWQARKTASCAPPEAAGLPDWIVLGAQPVPLSAAFQSTALTTRIHAFIMSLIDGRRSLKDMARILVEQRLMSAEDAESALRGFLIKMYEEARQPRRF
jgi:hypothetical protein